MTEWLHGWNYANSTPTSTSSGGNVTPHDARPGLTLLNMAVRIAEAPFIPGVKMPRVESFLHSRGAIFASMFPSELRRVYAEQPRGK